MGLFKSITKPIAKALPVLAPVFSMANGFLGEKGDAPGIDYSGQPVRPGFQSLLKVDEKGKYVNYQLPEELQRKEVVGAEGRTALKDRALAKGRSPWADMMIQKQQAEEQGQLGDLEKQAGSALMGAQAGLARSGGLRSGVGANLASQSMRDKMLQGQQVRQAGFGNRLGIDLQDDQTKMGLLQNLQNQDQNAAQFNIGNSIAEKRAKDVADMSAYSEQMKSWAARQQGNAIQNSGKK